MRSALIRAVRTFLQVLAGSLVALPTADAVTDIVNLKDPILLALWLAGWAAVISFVQNAAETFGKPVETTVVSTGPIPRG